MAVLGIDIGGTKMSLALFAEDGTMINRSTEAIKKGTGAETGKMIVSGIASFIDGSVKEGYDIVSAGICIPGIYRHKEGTVWAPNIPGWENYPLLKEVKSVTESMPVVIDSDRACYIMGECWKGNARGCRDAIFIAVGTGIGAGIMTDGNILRGANDIAGATGWMALDKPFRSDYVSCGCFEYHASGEGIAKVAREYLAKETNYRGLLADKSSEIITSHDVFSAFEANDPLAVIIVDEAVEYWGMAVANFVSLFNPEKIIFGGGVFGPAVKLIPRIREEAKRWAQPVSINMVSIEPSGLGSDAGVYGAGYLALKSVF